MCRTRPGPISLNEQHERALMPRGGRRRRALLCRAADGTDADSPAHVAGDLFTRGFDLILRYPWDVSLLFQADRERACSSLPGDQEPVQAGLVADPTFMVV